MIRSALVEHDGLARVLVFGEIGLAEHPPAEGDHVAEGVDDGEDEPPAQRVDEPPALFGERHGAAFEDVFARMALVQKVLRQALEIERRAQPELAHHRRGKSAVEDVLHVRVGMAGIEVVQVKVRRLAQDPEHGVAAALFLHRLFGVEVHLRHGQLGALGQDTDRVDEVDRFDLADEGDHVSGHAAAEAMVELFGGVDRKGRRLFMMKGTASPVVAALLFQMHVPADHLDQIVLVFQLLQKCRIESSCHIRCRRRTRPSFQSSSTSLCVSAQLRGTNRLLNTATANLSVIDER